MQQYRRDDMVFDVIDTGPPDGTVVGLLHGFPQFNTSWNEVIRRLTAEGYRCLAPNQRGYSRGARPIRRRDYRLRELVEDVHALIDASGAQRVHLVGYDWGASLAWAAAGEIPERLASLTTMSVPHPAAFLKALATSRQFFASWYIYFFQLPGIPEWYFGRHDWRGMSNFMQSRAKQPPEAAVRDARAMAQSGALTSALNWYRAIPLTDMRRVGLHKVTVPTMYVWSDGDTGLLTKGARNTGRYIAGEYRFETLHGSHWMLDEQPDKVADLLLDWFAGHPA